MRMNGMRSECCFCDAVVTRLNDRSRKKPTEYFKNRIKKRYGAFVEKSLLRSYYSKIKKQVADRFVLFTCQTTS